MKTTEKDRMIDIMNELVQLNNERVECYQDALKETKNEGLQKVFNNIIGESQKFSEDLSKEITNLGGSIENVPKIKQIVKDWTSRKSHVRSADEVMTSCQEREDAILESYQEIIRSNNLSEDIKSLILSQKERLELSNDKVKKVSGNVRVAKEHYNINY